jgi:hypothetical protein
MLQLGVEYNNIFFYQYNKKCKQLLNEYGDCKINKLYLVRQPFGELVSFALNIFTLFQYSKYINESQENCPYHSAFIVEIKKNNEIKFLLLEKNNCINICETFLINKIYEFKRIPLKKNKLTLNKILNKTQERLGNRAYFNWNIYKNNCQEFAKEVLISVDQYTEYYKEFIFRDKIIKIHNLSEFSLHIINCVFIFMNFFEKYIIDYNLFC